MLGMLYYESTIKIGVAKLTVYSPLLLCSIRIQILRDLYVYERTQFFYASWQKRNRSFKTVDNNQLYRIVDSNRTRKILFRVLDSSSFRNFIHSIILHSIHLLTKKNIITFILIIQYRDFVSAQ